MWLLVARVREGARGLKHGVIGKEGTAKVVARVREGARGLKHLVPFYLVRIGT